MAIGAGLMLRVAKGPLSTRQIAAQIVAQRGLDSDLGIPGIMTRRAGHVLRAKRELGMVRALEETALRLIGSLCGMVVI